MGWTEQHGLQTRLASLPPLLAGPVLRQVTSTAVTVWVALKHSYNVKLDILTSDSDSATPILSGSLSTTALGTNLHMVAVTARPTTFGNSLSEGNIYFYNLSFTPTGGSAQPLTFSQALTAETGSTGGVTVKSVFGCGTYSHPSFALPPTSLDDLKILHGSCRKPHAEGRDALSIVETLIQQNCSDPLARPHQLLLTGDQIYADDVADGLLLMLTDAGETLLGWSETVDEGNGTKPLRFAGQPSYYRQALMEEAGFTSDDLKSHLMSLGEFLSMYLFVWSGVLWPPTLPTFDDVNDSYTKLLGPLLTAATSTLAWQKPTIEGELRSITLFTSTLPNVRRALANIPTYMICDDHEVTDDWNMTRRFCNLVYGKPIGRRIVQNALTAFALCQAWGNNPDRFSATPATAGGTLLSTLAKVSSQAAASQTTYEQSAQAFQTLLGIHPGPVVLDKGAVFHDPETDLPPGSENRVSLRFDFRVEGPGHLILVTDTRTWRAFPKPGPDTHADFLPNTSVPPQLTSQLSIDPNHALGDRILIVVLTTNAPPYRSFRTATANAPLVDVGEHPGDAVVSIWFPSAEDWTGPSDTELKRDLTHGPRAIYGDDLYDSWELPGDSFNRLITQINALAQKGSRKQVLLLSGDVHTSFASRLTVFGSAPGGGAAAAAQLVVGQLVSSPLKNQTVKTRGQQLEGFSYAPKEYERIPMSTKNKPEAFQGSGGLVYRLDYLVADPGQPPPGGFPDPLNVVEGEDVANLANYHAMRDVAGIILAVGASPLQIVGHNNVAELKFVDANVLHALHWYGPSGAPFTTTYTVSLALNDSTYKMLTP